MKETDASCSNFRILYPCIHENDVNNILHSPRDAIQLATCMLQVYKAMIEMHVCMCAHLDGSQKAWRMRSLLPYIRNLLRALILESSDLKRISQLIKIKSQHRHSYIILQTVLSLYNLAMTQISESTQLPFVYISCCGYS